MIAKDYTEYTGNISPKNSKRLLEALGVPPENIIQLEINFGTGFFTATSVSVEKPNKPEVAP